MYAREAQAKGLVSSADLKTRRDGFRLGKVREPPADFLRVSSRPSRLCHTCRLTNQYVKKRVRNKHILLSTSWRGPRC